MPLNHDSPSIVKPLAEIAAQEAERLRALTNPWDVLGFARRSDDLRWRARAYPKFVALAASWPDADVDMLLAEARKTFRVRITVMRTDLRAAKGQAERHHREPV